MSSNTSLLEQQEQVAFVAYLELLGLKFTALPFSTFTKSWKQKNTNKRMGVRAGLPDLLIIIPTDKGRNGIARLLFIEMKRTKGGHLSDAQREWIATLNAVDDGSRVAAFVAKGYDQAVGIVNSYLKPSALKGEVF